MTVGKVDDLLLRHLRYAVETAHDVFPFLAVDEGVDEHVGPVFIALERLVVGELHVVDHRRQQVVGEVADLELAELADDEAAQLAEALVVLGYTRDDEARIVVQSVVERAHALCQHLLLEVDLEESGLAVGEHFRYHVERVGLHVGSAFEAPRHHKAFRFLTYDGGILHRCEGFQLRILRA